MNSKEACTEWVQMLRLVASGAMTPAEALVRRPQVADTEFVPSAFWSARDMLEAEIEFGSENPDWREYFAAVMQKLADRIEAHQKSRT